MSIKVIVENKIPFIKGILDRHCDVQYLAPEEITAETMRSADALITRTRTRCDASLLDGSRCRFIATATIGTDHIDLDYCRRSGIAVVNAPGCNAPAVAQYVLSSILSLREMRGDLRPLSSLSIGIVGVGHVGGIVARWCRMLGMTTLLCDPPRAEREGFDGFVDMDCIARQADIVTFHTPLTCSGDHPTLHMCNAGFLASTRRRPVIINSARGAVVDTPALIDALRRGVVSDAVIDCWENEPDISLDLLQRTAIATPHIAGYSREGKIRATSMALQAFCRYFNLPASDVAETVPPTAADIVTPSSILASYTPIADTLALRTAPSAFESLRNNYTYRSEPKDFQT